MTAVGFEPTPLRNGALSHRLGPLGHTVLVMQRGELSEAQTKAPQHSFGARQGWVKFLAQSISAYDGKSAKYLLVEGDLADPL